MAFVSPSTPRQGEWSGHQPIIAAQVAATLIQRMGGDWKLFDPAAAPPIPNP
jgi:hypothetical protein